ncbi:hypothetical protein [Phytohabitans aurantiacus]|uniref:Uncharacterized protein n=1 Tax=Phytohabitans aurantiacus TaxID=3016789 RepID=A0ABQ5QUF8_9ACTN|nr:hypothetical protein [Phytohabitans aurantiacus]GLH97349.1 hypothetical protein Pa4123_26240 [Phytohabitans aurantiacus]
MAADGYADTSDPTKLDLAGGTMTGPLVLEDGSPAASEEYVANNGGGGGTPSTTVVSETTYGQAASAGNATAYSRGNHTHGTPVLPNAAQVGADAAGTAAAAVVAHAGASDPHGDRAYADAAVTTHNADSTSVHGIADTSTLETQAGATSKANAAQAAAIAASAQRASNLSDLASASTSRTNLGLGDSATRAVGTAAGTVAAGDHTHEGGGGSTVVIRRKRITSGNVAGSNTSGNFVVCNNGTEDLAVVIPAAVDDVIQVSARFMAIVGGGIALDLAALGAANAIVEYGSTNGAAPDFDGEPGWYTDNTYLRSPGSAIFKVTAPMLVSGDAKIALVRRGTGGAGQVYADTNYSFRIHAINFGAVDFDD